MTDSKTTLVHLLQKALNRYSEEEVVLATKRNGTWTEVDKQTLTEKITRFAYGLHALGVRPGDRVSLHSENSAEWIICDLAIMSIGAVTVPIYTTQPGEQVKFILENSEARIHIVSTDELFAETKPIMKSIGTVESVISIHGSRHESLRHFQAVLKMGEQERKDKPDLLDRLRASVEPENLATLIYTSGTTGRPKGVMLSHRNITFNILASLERVPFSLEEIPGRNVLSYLPLSHVFERMISYLFVVMGAHIYYIESVDEIRDDFQKVKPFFFATVPRLLEKIQHGIKARGQELQGVRKSLYYWSVRHAESHDPENPESGLGALKGKIADRLVYSKIRQLFGGNLNGMICGGAPLSPEIFRFINGIGLYCGQGYGLTETSPVIAVQDPNHMRIGSSGLPLSRVEVKIADDGEIVVRGPNVMQGYFRDEEQTREVLDENGWLRTGDVGRLDDDGYLFITDRKKAQFKLSTGKYVSPQPIETALINSSFIEQAVVTGYQRKYCTALLVPAFDNVKKRLKRDEASMQKKPSEDPNVRRLLEKEVEKVNRTLSSWETIKRFAILDRAFTIENGELTPTMKIKRNVVYKSYKEVINALYDDEEQNVADTEG